MESFGPPTGRELELLVDGGISPVDALRIATLHGAMFRGKEHELGFIAPGKMADLVLLDGDPTRDIDQAKRIHTVIKGGQVVDRKALKIPANQTPH